jgi:phage portal protein BeeE
MGRSQFWGQWIRSALLRGMGYVIFEEAADYQPVAGTMMVLDPDSVSAQYDPTRGLHYRRIGSEHGGGHVDTDFNGRFQLGGRGYRLVELTNPVFQVDEDGVTKGVLEVHAAELGLAQQATAYAQGMYRSGVPSGILKVSVPNYSKEQADKLRAQFLASHGGDTRSVAVLNATTDFTPLSFKPIDMDLVKARMMSILDVANMFGVPSFFLGYDGSSGNTYSNAESRNQDLRQSLLHWATAIEDVVGSLFPQGEWVEVDFRGLLRPDTKTRYESYSLGLSDGWLTVDEVRALENLPPLPEGDAPPEPADVQQPGTADQQPTDQQNQGANDAVTA